MSTIAKVAERAGVSRTTVSHVVNHASRVSKPLRERVQAAIDELGYVPNRQAQSLRTGRTNVVALLTADIHNPFYTEMVRTVQAELEKLQLDVMVFNTDVPGGHSQVHGRDYLREITTRRVDGLIVGDVALHGINEELLRLDVPAVFLGHLNNHAVDSVRFDSFNGAFAMGQYLARKGHRRVANVTGPSFFEEANVRRDGFEAGLAAAGVEFDPALRFEGSYLEPSGRAAVEWLLEEHRGNMPSAIFFANYLMSMGGMPALYDHGIKVPDDIAVAAFDDLPQFEYVRPRLTRVGNSPAALVERAVPMLFERLSKQYLGPPRTETVPCHLLAFDSA
ncbi:MAG TPA: LacI family DNA-binding transcriptional regulator [Devosia sp.]|jgi:DNA-binding LacI/PurR family transcriptional regulator|nr:LacI family DNA-binding transcriptional regulator [Devosia sp.]